MQCSCVWTLIVFLLDVVMNLIFLNNTCIIDKTLLSRCFSIYCPWKYIIHFARPYNLDIGFQKCIYSCMQQERRKHEVHFIYSTKEIEAVENIRHMSIFLVTFYTSLSLSPTPPWTEKRYETYGCVNHQEFLSLSFHAPLETPSAKNLMLLNQ